MAESPRIVKGFEDLIKYLVAHEKDVAEAVTKQAKAKPWMNFSGDELSEKAEKKAEDELAKVFKRDDANEDYEKARTSEEAKSKQVALAKLAGDFLAACERDKRAQWRSRTRWIAHAVSRRWGNGRDSGPIRRNTLDYLSRIYMKAREIPTSGS